MQKIYCCFGQFLDNMAIERQFLKSGAEVMFLGQYFSAEYLRQEKGENQYQLWVLNKSVAKTKMVDINSRARSVEGNVLLHRKDGELCQTPVTTYLFGKRESPESIRGALERDLGEVEFEYWDNFLKGVAAQA